MALWINVEIEALMEQAVLHNTVAAANGTAMSFDKMAPEGLGDLNRVGDQATFAKDVDAITAKVKVMKLKEWAK